MKRTGRRGYTVVEVIAAMTLFAIGAAGVISMEKVTIQGGDDARRFDIATNIANQWAARLQRDSTSWTKPDVDNPTSENYSSATKWLVDIVSKEDQWHTPAMPTSSNGADSPAYDIFGHELVAADTGQHIFCTQMRLHWVMKAPTTLGPWVGMMMRAEVRVVWARLETKLIGDCATLGIAPDPTKYHSVYVTTALRPNPAK